MQPLLVSIFTTTVSIIIGLSTASTNNQRQEIFSQPESCGVADNESRDSRLRSPWICSIFIRYRNASNKMKFLTSCVVVSDRVIATHFGGIIAVPPKKRGPYKMPNPKDMFVIAGANSTDLDSSTDEYTQFLEVAHIQPYTGFQDVYKQFHLVLIHLKNPLRITSYTHPPCFIWPEEIRLKSRQDVLKNLYPSQRFATLHGYTYPPRNGHYQLASLKVMFMPYEECSMKFMEYYGIPMPLVMSCAKSAQFGDRSSNTSICLQHNSIRTENLFGNNLYVTGTATVIRNQKKLACTSDTTYFIYIISEAESKWFIRVTRCSPKFSCTGDKNCIDWWRVCDSITDCSNDEDEDMQYCNALRYSESSNDNERW